MKRLPDTELEVMKALWAQEGGAARAELEHALRDKGWASNTINTYLARLCEKGFVSCEKRGKANWYAPLVSQADYLSFESSAVLDKFFGKSLNITASSLKTWMSARPYSESLAASTFPPKFWAISCIP